LENKWARAIDLWFENFKEGYIVEFLVECNEYISSVERKFPTDPRGRLLK
jgi:hypothetical protein